MRLLTDIAHDDPRKEYLDKIENQHGKAVADEFRDMVNRFDDSLEELQMQVAGWELDKFLEGVGDLVRAYKAFYPKERYGSMFYDRVRDWSKDFDI